MKTFLTLISAFIIFSSLSACNTVSGVGKDLEQAGKSMQKGAREL